jgi:hypothetical protein
MAADDKGFLTSADRGFIYLAALALVVLAILAIYQTMEFNKVQTFYAEGGAKFTGASSPNVAVVSILRNGGGCYVTPETDLPSSGVVWQIYDTQPHASSVVLSFSNLDSGGGPWPFDQPDSNNHTLILSSSAVPNPPLPARTFHYGAKAGSSPYYVYTVSIDGVNCPIFPAPPVIHVTQ